MIKRRNGKYEYTLDVAQQWVTSGTARSFIIYCKKWVLCHSDMHSFSVFDGDVQGGFNSSIVQDVGNDYYIYYVELNSDVNYSYIVLDGDDSLLLNFQSYDSILSNDQFINEVIRLANLRSPNPPIKFDFFDNIHGYHPPERYNNEEVLAINPKSLQGGEVVDLSGNQTAILESLQKKDKAIYLDKPVNIGDIGNVQSVAMRIRRNGDTYLFESKAGSGGVSVLSNTLTYTEFDTAYVNGSNTDNINGDVVDIVLTSSTAISFSDLTLNKDGANSGIYELVEYLVYGRELSASEAQAYHDKWNTVKLKEQWQYPVGGNDFYGRYQHTGIFTIKEYPTGSAVETGYRTCECLSNGILRIKDDNLTDDSVMTIKFYNGSTFTDYEDTLTNLSAQSWFDFTDGVIIFTLTTGQEIGRYTVIRS